MTGVALLRYASDSRIVVSFSGARTLFKTLTTVTGSVGEIITPNRSAAAMGSCNVSCKTRAVTNAEIMTPPIARPMTVLWTVSESLKAGSHG